MAHSIVETDELTCPACGERFPVDIWLNVYVNECLLES